MLLSSSARATKSPLTLRRHMRSFDTDWQRLAERPSRRRRPAGARRRTDRLDPRRPSTDHGRAELERSVVAANVAGDRLSEAPR
jgi:hypothetical protein